MKIFIVGAGEVGLHIATSLTREDHDLVVIERDPKKVEKLQSSMDILAVAGNGCNARLLKAHGIANADLFFAVSNDDTANVLAALTARRLGAGRCVVRVGQPKLGDNPLLESDPDIILLYPERLVAEEILGLTRVPGASKARLFAEGRLILLQARPSSTADIYGKPLQSLPAPEGWVLVGIHRASGLVIPRGDTTLRRGDLLYAVGRAESVHGYLGSIGVASEPVRSVVIAGAGRVGRWLARILVKEQVRVTVIQRTPGRAFDLAAEQPKVLVLRGDAREPDILREAGAEEADYFVSTTQQDEVNLLSALLAREMGARTVVALYNQPEYLQLLQAVRIDLPLSPRLTVAGTILRMVHRREIVSLDLVEGGEAEVVEFEVPARARVLRAPLMDLKFPRSAIVGAVARGPDLFVPDGAFKFQEGDRGLVFTLSDALPALEKIFPGTMNYRGVLFLLGRLLLALAVALLVPGAVAWWLGGAEMYAFAVSAAATGLAGILLERIFSQGEDFRFGRREAFLLVTAAWAMASVVGALPYVLLKGPDFAVNALFESASGFTTTGASVLDNVEAEPAGLILWRSLTQWLGGMGIIVLGIAILPKLAVGGMQLLGAEAPGPTTEKLTPRIAQTAKALWGIYALLTLLETAFLIVLGMTPLDAVNHSLTTMATGGFSTRNASVGAFGPGIQIVITGFMVLAGVNFALHFKLLRGRPRQAVTDPELRLYLWLLTVATLLLTFDLVVKGRDLLGALRLAAFQSTTIVTTTGFATENFDLWPSFSRALLFVLMFVGGCSGSTGGSVKVVRVLIVGKKVVTDLKQMVQPSAVLPVRVGSRAIPEEVVASVTTFFILFLLLFAAGGLLLGLLGLDLVSAFSASASCLGNIGPGFGLVGPAETYTQLPALAKLLLVALMIVGRLELYTVLVIVFLSRRLF